MNYRRLMVFTMMLAILALPLVGAKTTTDMDLEWGGLGYVSGTFTSSDGAVVEMYAGGFTHGQFHATDADDNPYNYQVDTTSAWFKGYIDDNGELFFNFKRTRLFGADVRTSGSIH